MLLILPVAIHFVAPGALGGLYKSFFPKEGLIGDVQGRAGEAGSGRFADIGPGLRIWTESPVVGHGPGSTIKFQREETHLGPAPIPPVIFDNQYMSTLVQLGLLGLIGAFMLVWGSTLRLFRAAQRSTGPPSDLLTACAVSLRRLRGGDVLLRRLRVRADARSCSSSSPPSGCAWRGCERRRPILVESRTTPG